MYKKRMKTTLFTIMTLLIVTVGKVTYCGEDNMNRLKLSSFVLLVSNVVESKKFYIEMLDQEVSMDINNINVGFKSGLALWEKQYAKNIIFDRKASNIKDHDNNGNVEVYFETTDLDKVFDKMNRNNVPFVHTIKVQPWQQRVFRIYDPDKFVIEVAELMEDVIKRLHKEKMTIEMISEKTFMPKEVVESLINKEDYPFIGTWQGNGTDSEGNPFNFFAKVSHLGDNKYRVLILDKLDTLNEPIHIMDGALENNKYSYTADEGLYEGGGTLSEDLFEGYYKGSIDGTYKMWRTNSEIETK